MVHRAVRRIGWRLAAMATGGAFLLGGCDPTTQAAFQDGIINASTSLLGAFIQAWIQLFLSQQTTTT